MSRYEQEASVPHVNIKHFPVPLSEQQQATLIAEVTREHLLRKAPGYGATGGESS